MTETLVANGTEKGIGKECKDFMVQDVARHFEADKNLFITGFWGLSAEDMSQLRKALSNASSRYLVVKNSIAKRALKSIKMNELIEHMTDGVGIAFGGKDPVATAKALVTFAKTHEKLQIKSGYLDGKIIDTQKIKQISALPSREALLAKLAWVINSPISGFVNVLAATIRSFVYVIKAYKEKQAKGG